MSFSLAAVALRVENLTLTGTAAISGTGTALDNILIGNSGANVLKGLDGTDTLNGGVGADQMFGGTGNDTYVVDNVGDVVNETGGDGTDTVLSSVSFSLADACTRDRQHREPDADRDRCRQRHGQRSRQRADRQ